jgi:hypothetical protein
MTGKQKNSCLNSQMIGNNIIDNLGPSVITAVPAATCIPAPTKSDFDFRYEFSETRKVLDEFFNKAENEFPARANPNMSTIKSNETELVNVAGNAKECGKNETQREGSIGEFNDLNYTLRRFSPNTLFGSTAVGQRLAGTDEEFINNAVITNSSSICPNIINVKSLTINDVEGSNTLHKINSDALSNPVSNLMDSREDASLAFNDVIDRSDSSKKEYCESYHSNGKESNQIPSNTYHTQQQIRNMYPANTIPFSSTVTDIGIQLRSSSTASPSSTFSVVSGFPLRANPSNISASTNSTVSNIHQITNNITTNPTLGLTSSVNNTDSNIIDTREGQWDDSETKEMQYTKDPFVLLTDPSHSTTGPTVKQVDVSNISVSKVDVSNIDGLITNSLQQSQPQCATALVGDTRLNVATHYVTTLTPEFQQPLVNTTDVIALNLDDTARDIEPNDTYDTKCNIQLNSSTKDIMKISSIPNSAHFSANRNLGTLSSNASNVLFSAATFGAEKGSNTVPPVTMISSNLVASGTIASGNFTLSPETTDCDSADLESEVSLNEGSYHSSGPKFHTAMPILEDGLSSGHASDLEDDVIYSSSGSVLLKKQQQLQQQTHHHHQGPSNNLQHQLKQPPPLHPLKHKGV